MTDENGYISDKKAYSILPNLAINKIIDKGLIINNRKITFLHAGDKKVISDPLELSYKTKNFEDYYSISTAASIQTTPHSREPLLIFNPKITRWVKRPVSKELVKRSNTTVYVRSGEKTLYPLGLSFENGKIVWEPLSQKIFNNLFIGFTLPDPYEYYLNPYKYTKGNGIDLYMNYRLEMGLGATYVKTGLPMIDKLNIYESLVKLLEDFTQEVGEVKKALLGPTKYKNNTINDKPELFRHEISKAIRSTNLDIEIYYEYESEVLKLIEDQLKANFGIDNLVASTPELNINISFKQSNVILNPLDSNVNEVSRHEKRIREIQDTIEKAKKVTACLIMLPFKNSDGTDFFDANEDPKRAIRAGFAVQGKLTQFIDNNIENNVEHRVTAAILDMYRQLGYIKKCQNSRKAVLADYSIPITALHIVNYKKTPYGNTDRCLVTLTIDQNLGEINVECPALWKGKKLYWEACLMFQAVATGEGIKKFTKTRVLDDIKSKVYELYNLSKEPHVMIVNSNGTTRNVWKLLTDSELSQAEKSGDYTLKKIWFNNENKADGIDTNVKDSGLRIIRIRTNEEVPGYLSPAKEEGGCESRSGLFKYNGVFYGIGARPNDITYKRTTQAVSKIQKPQHEFKLPDMIEIYPMHLKESDVPDHWVSLVNNYREAAHQYKGVLVEPLPLHLASKLEEYIY